MSFTKKIFLVVFVIAFMFSFYSYFTNKDKVNNSTFDVVQYNRNKIYQVINDPALNQTQNGKMMIAAYKGINCMVMGEGCTDNPDDGNSNYQSSIMGGVSNILAFPFTNKPASGIEYVAGGLGEAGFIPDTFAAEGIGYAALKPLIPLWKVFRDIAYLVLAVVMVVIGFMIMFRMQLDSQTVISVTNALPKIVISLILITFSFAIAGFVIDLMYLFIAISVSMLADDPARVGKLQNMYLSAEPSVIMDSALPIWQYNDLSTKSDTSLAFWSEALGMFGFVPIQIARTIANLGSISFALIGVLPSIIQTVIYAVGGLGVVLSLDKFLDILEKPLKALENMGAFTFDLGGIISGSLLAGLAIFFLILIGMIIVPIIMMLFILFTIVFLFFRVFVMLLVSYLKILMLVIFSPLIMLLDAIPGQSGFTGWFKSLFGELMSFVIVVVLLMVGERLVLTMLSENTCVTFEEIGSSSACQQIFFTPPFLYGLNQDAYAMLIGMGLILLIPDLVQLFKKTIGVEDFPVKFGLNTFFYGGTTLAGGAFSLLTQFSSINTALRGDNRGLINTAKEFFGRGKGDGTPPITATEARNRSEKGQ